jgi:hypothetical protein
MKDIVVRSTVAGCIGGLIYQVFVWIFNFIGIAKITPFQIGAYMLVKPGSDYTMVLNQLLGSVQHFSNSILLAFIAASLSQLIGLDYYLLKGVAFGAILYFIIYGVIGRFIIPVSLLQPDIATSTIYLFGNLLYGLAVTYTLTKLYRPKPTT